MFFDTFLKKINKKGFLKSLLVLLLFVFDENSPDLFNVKQGRVVRQQLFDGLFLTKTVQLPYFFLKYIDSFTVCF